MGDLSNVQVQLCFGAPRNNVGGYLLLDI